ncbi:hypothetical protein [Endozoicomonas arenosclerae]|uniref:hypothetical protein n=1 Tax=Endozoicomonas arenosclerae TaxID=1633495 RepID=UPI000784EF23|nr:hypothetical protein [Endozoicomonas arenosclerae]
MRSLSEKAKAANHSMEQEVWELLEVNYPNKQDRVDRIRNRRSQLSKFYHEEVDEWRNEG